MFKMCLKGGIYSMLLVLEAVTMFTDSSGDPCGNDSELNFPQPLRRMIKVFITELGASRLYSAEKQD